MLIALPLRTKVGGMRVIVMAWVVGVMMVMCMAFILPAASNDRPRAHTHRIHMEFGL